MKLPVTPERNAPSQPFLPTGHAPACGQTRSDDIASMLTHTPIIGRTRDGMSSHREFIARNAGGAQ